jgi:hypothetical protein
VLEALSRAPDVELVTPIPGPRFVVVLALHEAEALLRWLQALLDDLSEEDERRLTCLHCISRVTVAISLGARISRRLVEDARARIEERRQRLDRVRNRLQIGWLRRALQDRQQPREREEIGERMPTLTLSSETLAALGVRREHLVPTFTPEGRRLLEALLTSCGFNMARAVRVLARARRRGPLLDRSHRVRGRTDDRSQGPAVTLGGRASGPTVGSGGTTRGRRRDRHAAREAGAPVARPPRSRNIRRENAEAVHHRPGASPP